METAIQLFKATRENTLNVIKNLSLDEFNMIPEGFSGNIIWHLGHMVLTHHGLVYKLNGLEDRFDNDFVNKYKKGSVPIKSVTQEELQEIIGLLESQISEFESDLKKEDFFGDNIAYMTSYNFEMKSLEESVTFNNLHQALHLGYIMALKRVVRN